MCSIPGCQCGGTLKFAGNFSRNMIGNRSIMQPGTPHSVRTSEETIAEVHSIGPWSVNYINPADDPAKR
jgi:hypothetical protein